MTKDFWDDYVPEPSRPAPVTEREIQEAILRICKVAGYDSDINMEGFLSLCDKLKQFGAWAEREACAKVADHYSMHDQDTPADIAAAIRARVNT